MRHWIGKYTVLLAVVACADSAPTSSRSEIAPTMATSPEFSRGDDHDEGPRGKRAFNTRMLAENEVPTSTSLSSGFAQVRVPRAGAIRSLIEIRNTGNEVIRFCHIHAKTGSKAGVPTAETGPVVWFLTPTGVNMNLISSFLVIGQDADYVTNAEYGDDTADNEAAARAELIREPNEFYVNCHSNAFPAGFVRGTLPGGNGHGRH